MGGVASLAEDDSIAFRVRFSGAVPPPQLLYWRGPVLSNFDGREWTRLAPSFPASLRPQLELELSGEPVRYEMTVEPSRLPLLPLLEMTPDEAGAAPRIEGWLLQLRSDAQWQVDRPLTERVRVQAAAWLQHRHGPRDSVLGLRDLVRLPPGFNPRTAAVGGRTAGTAGNAGADAPALAQLLLAAHPPRRLHLHAGARANTAATRSTSSGSTASSASANTTPPPSWWRCAPSTCRRASSPATRAPTRAVRTAGGSCASATPTPGPNTGRPDVGWVRVDPTAAVAPDRVQRSCSLRPPPGLVAGALGAIDPAFADPPARRLGDA